MRSVLIGDLLAAAEVLAAVPEPARADRLARLLRGAALAERHRQRTGRAHPRYGDGSLMAAAMKQPRAPGAVRDAEFRRCLGMVLAELE
ncbi:hypothetical protein CBW24_06290 [Pacificitalea manganoxidans]|uniref:DUF7742 domain-containing protein n=1 Tax=Pacificitalea manganoxidans TaxID=1411902 RepID=A0A291LY27_9RHOB|nr:hypothetical protein [Pacificitalea manganoxidans]ATI41646.1 hypothetical protein CBW24_06290 [Pacificitalea manganoxidans]MDR6309089.1 hypothetical protein [Pacificitalea manganoxidans]